VTLAAHEQACTGDAAQSHKDTLLLH
jgi:hypothetical protein